MKDTMDIIIHVVTKLNDALTGNILVNTKSALFCSQKSARFLWNLEKLLIFE